MSNGFNNMYGGYFIMKMLVVLPYLPDTVEKENVLYLLLLKGAPSLKENQREALCLGRRKKKRSTTCIVIIKKNQRKCVLLHSL